MIRVIKLASAFVAVIVGAGFASGQEILLYFTRFGMKGMFAASFATVLFTYFGMILLKVGSRLKTTSHEQTFHFLGGRLLGTILDILITCALFGVGVVMISGAGSIVEQQYGAIPVIGSLGLVIIIILTLLLDVEKIINLLGMSVPFLIIAIVGVSVYSLLTMEVDFVELDLIAKSHPSPLPNWFVSAVNYVSLNITLGAGMAFLIGSAEKEERTAAAGGFLGGLIVGLLVVFSHVAMLSRIDVVMYADMPLLLLMNEISTKLGIVMTFVLLAMIYSTAVGMFYTFIARFFEMTSQAKIIPIIITVCCAFWASFIGFTKLVALFYPLIGYLGLVLMVILIYAPFKMKKIN